MKLNDINIRDPYIIKAEGKYYMYGTRSATTWSYGDGFDCYISEDLENWEGPKEIFHRPEGFFADKQYWAPECVEKDGYYYLVATLGSDKDPIGCHALRSTKPDGPFEPYSKRLTPEGVKCLDGTVYTDPEGTSWLVYSRSFENGCRGYMDCIQLASDLSHSIGEAFTLFDAAEAKWVVPFPYAKEEFGVDGDVYFTDGPCLQIMEDSKLYMTWSSWGTQNEYAVGVAVSDNGSLKGPWRQVDEAMFPVDGGHGMFFTDYDGKMYFTLHYPNEKLHEHPVFYPVTVKDGNLVLVK